MVGEVTVSAESEVRWQAWLVTGRVRELRTRRRARRFGLVLLVVVLAVFGAFVLA
jgi:hypothetical protein